MSKQKWMLIILAFLFVGGCGIYQPAIYQVTDLNSGRMYLIEEGKSNSKVINNKMVLIFGKNLPRYYYGSWCPGDIKKMVVLNSWEEECLREGRWVK